MVKNSGLIIWFIIPAIIYSCNHGRNTVPIMTGIEGDLYVLPYATSEKEDCSYRYVDRVKTYYVSTLQYYSLTIDPKYNIQRQTLPAIYGDVITFDDATDIITIDDSKTSYTPYAEIAYDYSDNVGPEYKVWFTKEGTFNINFSYGDFSSSIRVCVDNDSTFHSEYWTKLSTICSWIDTLKVEDLTEVILEEGYNGVAPGSFVNVTHTKDKDDMTNARYLLDSLAIKTNTPASRISGGGYKNYTYKAASESHTLSISNGFIYYNDGENSAVYYLLPKTISITNPYQEAYKFHTYGSSDSVDIKKVSDDSVLTSIDYFSDIEFVEWGEETSSATTPLYYIDDYSKVSNKLTIYANNRFEYQEKFYKIIGDKTFTFCE